VADVECAIPHRPRAETDTRLLTAIAARQHGVVTGADLAAAGFGRGAVARRVADGRLRRLHASVFLLGPLHGPRTREMAAVLACGPGAVLSHQAAAALWGFGPAWRGAVDVIVAGRHPRRAGIRVHRGTLDPLDTRRREGVPTTSPARTLLDLAAVVPVARLENALEEAQVLKLVTPVQVAALLTQP
jgi:hypothetical protein